MSYIEAINIEKTYGQDEAAVAAISGMSFRVDSGEFVSVMGESGAGKSTLLAVLGAMNTPTAGKLLVDEIDIYALRNERRADFRREFLGFIFQSFHLVTYLTVMENVMLPLSIIKAGRKEKREMAESALACVGLQDKGDRLPSQISGGEKERVAIARAIVNNPPILLADEPTGNLDTQTTREIMELLCRLNSDGMTIMMVTHSPDCAGYAERLLRISDGRIVSDN